MSIAFGAFNLYLTQKPDTTDSKEEFFGRGNGFFIIFAKIKKTK